MQACGGWLLGLLCGGALGYVLGLVKQQAEHEHYRRHHDPAGHPHLLWSRRYERLLRADAAERPRPEHNIAT